MADAKQEMNNGSSQSRVVLAKPRFGGFGSSNFASSSNKGCNPFGSLLRPPQLKPGNNPFLKVTEAEENKDKEKEPENLPEDRLKDNKDDEAPKFVPLGSTNVTPRTVNPVPTPTQQANSSSSSAGFVFGQNLSARVVMNESVNNGDAVPQDHSSSNGNTELLFTSAAATVKENNQDEAGTSESNSSEGLAAAAAEYERSHAKPPPPTTTYTTTGEEGEINVLQISCRLFAWESGSWRERGRGVLRLNDAGVAGGASRLVVRVAGSLRVVLNTKLWPDMVADRAGTKSLRITAADAQQQVKLFLIMGAPSDIVQLYRALTARISMSKKTAQDKPCNQNSTSHSAAERLEASANVDEFLDNETGDTSEKDVNKTDSESHVDNTDDKKALKRKEPADDETSPKRQCPDIVIE